LKLGCDHFLSNSLLINHPIIVRCIVELLIESLKKNIIKLAYYSNIGIVGSSFGLTVVGSTVKAPFMSIVEPSLGCELPFPSLLFSVSIGRIKYL
jgi:hypothetical protein